MLPSLPMPATERLAIPGPMVVRSGRLIQLTPPSLVHSSHWSVYTPTDVNEPQIVREPSAVGATTISPGACGSPVYAPVGKATFVQCAPSSRVDQSEPA